MRNMPVEHSKFLWDIVSYISNLQAVFDFAIGCGIPSHMVRKAIEDNDPSDGDISLEECVVQALTVWWFSTNRPAIWNLRELSCLIQTPENAYGIVCMTNLPDEAFVYIRQEHTHFGLSIKGIQGRIAFPVLAIWYILAKGKHHVIPIIKDVFHDLELEDECAKIIDNFLGVVDRNLRDNRTPNKIQMGTSF